MEYPEEDALNIYTDGSMLPKPRRGGTGIIFILLDQYGREHPPYEAPTLGYSGASNNLMELQACVEALRMATAQNPRVNPQLFRKIVIHSDSLYVAGNYETAMFAWANHGWTKKDGSPIDNGRQWKELVQLIRKAGKRGKRVEIRWVKGKKSPRTKAVDKLAKTTAKSAPDRQLNPARVRRKRTSKELARGSVKMEGQRLTIRITKTEFQVVHRLTKCWYEVLSVRSSFRGCFDVVYAEEGLDLRAGHSYYVRVNADTANPRIAKVFREVELG